MKKTVNFEPIGQRVLVDVVFNIRKFETIAPTGMFIDLANPNIVEEEESNQTDRAIVLAISEESRIGLKVGDKIVYRLGSGAQLTFKEETYLLLNDMDVYGKETEPTYE